MTIHKSLLLASFVSLSIGQPCKAASVVDAIHAVESSYRQSVADHDDGGSIAKGPLQIHRNCWVDSRVPGTWDDCRSLEYSKRVFAAYCSRYHAETPEQQARLWNSGPNWRAKIHATDSYWQRVKEAMQ